MTDFRGCPTAEALVDALLDARRVELELLDGLTDAQMLGAPAHFLEPPIWEPYFGGKKVLRRRLDDPVPGDPRHVAELLHAPSPQRLRRVPHGGAPR